MNFSMTMSLMKVVVVAFISFFVFISAEAGVTADTSCTATNNEYAIVGVSGMLLIILLLLLQLQLLLYANYSVFNSLSFILRTNLLHSYIFV
jgi:hypothetical protein